MENSTRLLWRQQEILRQRRVLVVDGDDSALSQLPAAHVHVHADDLTVGANEWAPLPTLADDVDLVVLPLPKSTQRLELLLQWLAGSIRVPLEIWLVGPAKGGIRGGVTRLKKYAADVTLVDSARHCKVFSARLSPGPAIALSDLGSRFAAGAITAISYPGVFGHGRLDSGTALLLAALGEAPPAGRVLDVGCGSGVLSATLAAAGCQVKAVDVSATAVAATAATLDCNGLQGDVHGSDLYPEPSGRFQAIITNPPFHTRRHRTTATAHRLIRGAPAQLADQGVLWLVANRELPYARWLGEAFRQVEVVRENNRFRVYRAVR